MAKGSGAVIALNEPARPPNRPSEPGSAEHPAFRGVMGLGSIGIPTVKTRPPTTGPNSAVKEEVRAQLFAKTMRLGIARRKEPAVHSPPAILPFVGEPSQAAGAGSQQQLANAEIRPEAEGAPAAPPPAPVAERESGASNAPGAPRSAPAGGSAGALYAPSDVSIAGQGPPQSVSIRTADGVERWRLGANGTIEHLVSEGQWRRQDSGVTADLSAGAAPSPTVCWAVGAGGTVLRTTDGEHWQKLASPAPVNLIAVSAQDAVSGGRYHRQRPAIRDHRRRPHLAADVVHSGSVFDPFERMISLPSFSRSSQRTPATPRGQGSRRWTAAGRNRAFCGLPLTVTEY